MLVFLKLTAALDLRSGESDFWGFRIENHFCVICLSYFLTKHSRGVVSVFVKLTAMWHYDPFAESEQFLGYFV